MNKLELQKIYKTYASVYDSLFRYINMHKEVLLQTKKHCQKSKTIGDLCTGTGLFAEQFIGDNSKKVIGIDLVDEMLSFAIKKMKDYKNITFQKEDVQNTSLKDETLDSYVMINGLYHVQNPIKTIDEALRITKEKGKLIFAGPTPKTDFSIIASKIEHDFKELPKSLGLLEKLEILNICNEQLVTKNNTINAYFADELSDLLYERGCKDIILQHNNNYMSQAHYVVAKR